VAKAVESDLAAGIAAYENGDYAIAQRKLQSALEEKGPTADRIVAHKYLAFVACATGKRDACEWHFRQNLALDPSFTLSAAEAGHPVWGPIFKKLKGSEKKKGPAKKK
jgi:Tfp pilus assembly protein PilF